MFHQHPLKPVNKVTTYQINRGNTMSEDTLVCYWLYHTIPLLYYKIMFPISLFFISYWISVTLIRVKFHSKIIYNTYNFQIILHSSITDEGKTRKQLSNIAKFYLNMIFLRFKCIFQIENTEIHLYMIKCITQTT